MTKKEKDDARHDQSGEVTSDPRAGLSADVYCRCGHLRDDHGSRYEQGPKGEKRYVQKCEHCPCEVFTEKGGALDRMIESFQKVASPETER